ncbi:RES family NAD+ phosphorylase [Cronobacter dublinensis]|uniref:RES family NAD+ phosphorylase n=1 Tax=Cronobacter dublinensis TaxID=413497 RepID=UPI000CFC37C1|nr:RES family NAD+ phosphorylase [Cronobacter dublinensis]MDI6446516.1 RES family NAD+ phosphorylase [Cronobacter dublinensis]MDK1192857.1 RES family NAD+ phosphorylase [Cronobacter dublinensis]MDK1199102.1 RES family NAD+ phosphorylase [Cronobacter dublinensis]MDK1200557.1 RES family NAD+ phosphorylase [Cronobacter dublinensis]
MDITRFHNRINGVFYRAIDPAYRVLALSGSRAAGRYSGPDQPTLYLSSSPEGVDAAMRAHRDNRASLEIINVRVVAEKIFDLRDAQALLAAGIDLHDAVAPWQEIVNEGGIPRSWKVRERLESLGFNGLIDPSRKAPGLWHLVLFSWENSQAQVSIIE